MAILTPREKLIMQTAILQANVPVSELAKQLGMRAHTVRRGIEALYDRKIFLGKRPYINSFALGLTEYLFFVSLTGRPQDVREEFVQTLVNHERVGFVAEAPPAEERSEWAVAEDIQPIQRLYNKQTLYQTSIAIT